MTQQTAANQIDSLLSGLGGWGDLKAGEEAGVSQESQADIFQQAQVIAAPFFTPAGQQSLAVLRAMTTDNVAWNVELDLLNACGSGIHREGQNSIIRYIEQQMKIVEAGPPVSEEDETNG